MSLSRLFAPLALCLAAACANTSTTASSTTTIPDGDWVGEVEPAEGVVQFAALDADPAKYYDQVVVVEANAFAVCKRKQCWMQIEDQDHWATVRWDSGCGGQYAFPMEAEGQRVVVQGELYPRELSDAEIADLQAKGRPIPEEPYEFAVTAVMVLDR